jgi:hypothetical protein
MLGIRHWALGMAFAILIAINVLPIFLTKRHQVLGIKGRLSQCLMPNA